MYKTTFIFLFSISLFCKCQNSKQTPTKIPLSEVKFESIFGTRQSEKENVYCLLGTGFFRAPSAKNADSLIENWIKKHPKASLIPVHSHGPTYTDKPNSKMTYCWLVDGKDTINNYLVRTGCFPGGTMQKPPTWEEMTKNCTSEMKEMVKDEDKGKHLSLISDADYNRFIEQIKIADKYAFDNKLGVYTNEKPATTTSAKEDSLIKAIMAEQDKLVLAHDLHKDNKDSAWINDFNGSIVWESRTKSFDGKSITLVDSLTKNYYILDPTHTEITAYNKSKQIIWKTNPRKDTPLGDYRQKNPTITYFKIGPNEYGKGERVIHINYSNSQFGHLDLKTGKFNFSGQD